MGGRITGLAASLVMNLRWGPTKYGGHVLIDDRLADTPMDAGEWMTLIGACAILSFIGFYVYMQMAYTRQLLTSPHSLEKNHE